MPGNHRSEVAECGGRLHNTLVAVWGGRPTCTYTPVSQRYRESLSVKAKQPNNLSQAVLTDTCHQHPRGTLACTQHNGRGRVALTLSMRRCWQQHATRAVPHAAALTVCAAVSGRAGEMPSGSSCRCRAWRLNGCVCAGPGRSCWQSSWSSEGICVASPPCGIWSGSASPIWSRRSRSTSGT